MAASNNNGARQRITLGWRRPEDQAADNCKDDYVEVTACMEAAPILPSVVAPTYEFQSAGEMEPLDICLDCWVDWMAGDGDKDLGVKTMHLDRSQFLTGEEAQQARNNEIGAATDAMIDGLSMLHRWAIYTMRGLPTVWSFPRADILAVGPAAREALKLKLKWNVGTRLLF
jgi:hypothetical protein